jgi:outer membrane protein
MSGGVRDWRGAWRSAAAALVLASAAAGAFAQAGGARLSDIVALARDADAQYGAARAAAAAGRERLPQARAGLRPSVAFTHVQRRNRDGSTSYTGGTDSYDASSTSLILSQPIFRIANQVALEQAELQTELVEIQLAFAEQDLLLRVARAYFDVLQMDDELAVARAQKDAFSQQLAQARRSFEVGTAPITDLNEAQARHDLAVAQEIAVRNDLQLRQRLLERSIGRPMPRLARLKPDAPVALMDEATLQSLVDAAPNDSAAVRVGRLAVQVAAKEVARRDAGHQPTLDLVASVGHSTGVGVTPNFEGNSTRQASIGFELNIPLYQGGAVSSRVREAIAERLRAEQELLQTERQARFDAQQSLLGVQSGRALTQALQQAVASSESQVRSSVRGLQVGVRTRLDVLNAEQQLFTARKDLANARYRTLIAALQLRAVAGSLADADMQLVDRLLGD